MEKSTDRHVVEVEGEGLMTRGGSVRGDCEVTGAVYCRLVTCKFEKAPGPLRGRLGALLVRYATWFCCITCVGET